MQAVFNASRAVDGDDDPKRYTSAAAEGTVGISVKGSGGRLYGATVEVTSATQYWFMVFDKATAPVNTDVPIYRKRLTANGSVDLPSWISDRGLGCKNGIGIALSSTSGTLTLAVAADMLVALHYR